MQGISIENPAALTPSVLQQRMATATEIGALKQAESLENSPENLRKAARQFESIFINLWLKSAREANQILSKDNLMNSSELSTHQEMLDSEMSIHMASNGGIGLAETIVQQLSARITPSSEGARGGVPDRQIHSQQEVVVRKPAQRAQVFESAEKFVEHLKPIVSQLAGKVGLSVPGIISQAALETGWGKHIIQRGDGQSSHNLFGVKAKSDEPSVTISSLEFEQGQWQSKSSKFRHYESFSDSVQDHVNRMVEHGRYQSVRQAGEDARPHSLGHRARPLHRPRLQAPRALQLAYAHRASLRR